MPHEQSTLPPPARPGWRVLLCGTSNSVMVNGLAHGLATDPRVAAFVNRSFGASGSTALALHLREVDYSAFDLQILDYSVNEGQMLFGGASTMELYAGNLANAIDRAARAGCASVILNLTSRSGSAAPGELLGEMLRRRFAGFGVPVFDAAASLDAFTRRRRIDPARLYMDPMHLERRLARALGRVVLNRLEEARDDGALAGTAIATGERYPRLSHLSAAELFQPPPGVLVRRASRLTQVEVLPLASGPAYPLRHADETAVVIGIAYNAVHAGGALVDADGQPLLQLCDAPRYDPARNLVLIHVPCPPRPLAALRTLTLLSAAPTAPAPADPTPPTGLELVGVALSHPAETFDLHVIPFAPPHRHLDARMTRRDEHILFTALPPPA